MEFITTGASIPGFYPVTQTELIARLAVLRQLVNKPVIRRTSHMGDWLECQDVVYEETGHPLYSSHYVAGAKSTTYFLPFPYVGKYGVK